MLVPQGSKPYRIVASSQCHRERLDRVARLTMLSLSQQEHRSQLLAMRYLLNTQLGLTCIEVHIDRSMATSISPPVGPSTGGPSFVRGTVSSPDTAAQPLRC